MSPFSGLYMAQTLQYNYAESVFIVKEREMKQAIFAHVVLFLGVILCSTDTAGARC